MGGTKMANLTKIKRNKMLKFLEELKKTHNDDSSIRAFNEIENALTEKKFGLVFEEHTEEVDEKLLEEIPIFCEDKTRRLCMDENLPYNFIIQGDNLQVLYLLEKTHRGKIDCIYIDPPYNTGTKDWKYNNDYVDENDNYRHSKWLSMMKVRLLSAKKLLNPLNSTLICTIDEKEYLHLGCLLEELFPDAKIQMISTIINRAGTGRKFDFARVNEYIYFVSVGNASILPEYSYGDTKASVFWDVLRRSELTNVRAKTKTQFFPIFVSEKENKIHSVGDPISVDVDIKTVVAPKNCVAVFPIRDDGIETMWGCKVDELKYRISKGYVRLGKKDKNKPQMYPISYLKTGGIRDIENGLAVIDGYSADGSVIAHYKGQRKKAPATVWDNPLYDARQYGSYLIDSIIGKGKFDYPKSLYAVEDCIRFVIANNPNAKVLDFFAGSGTTMHAVNLLNLEDNGNRTCILVTNNEVSEKEAKLLKLKGITPENEEWENLGIAKNVTWPRNVNAIKGVDFNNEALKGSYVTCNKPMREGFKANVKFFNCGWTPRKPDDYLLSNVLGLHVKEMIELENYIEIDNVKNVIIFNRDDFNKYILNDQLFNKIDNLWINQNIIFSSEELEILNKKKFRYIPREYFGQELKEAAE